jgi:hypothetical protein
MRACKARIPCGIRRERKGNVWWSAKLRRIRAGVRKAGSQMQGERNQERRETFKKGEGSLQDGDQGGEDRGAPESPGSGKSGGSVGARVQAGHQQEEGSSNAVDVDPGRGELGRKPRWHSSGSNSRKMIQEQTRPRIAKREPRGQSGSDDQAREITQQELRRTIQEKPKKAPGIDGFPSAGLEHLAYRTSSNVALEVLAGCVPLHIEAASAHSTWVASKSRGFRG